MTNGRIYDELYELCNGDLKELRATLDELYERLENDENHEEQINEVFTKFKLSKNYTKKNFENICKAHLVDVDDALYMSAYQNIEQLIEEYKEIERLMKEV